jgi:hypothetical protein
VTIDIMLLVAERDAGSAKRLRAARLVAEEPEAPRRALASMPAGRAAPPDHYEGAILTVPAADDVVRTPRPETALARRLGDDAGFDLGRVLASKVSGVDPDESLSELTTSERLAGYDALSPADRRAWDATFRAVAADWIAATSAEFAGDDTAGRAGGWQQQVVSYPTESGGQLLICAADDSGVYDGVAAWFEATLFVLAEVAEAAGFREPVRFDVR